MIYNVEAGKKYKLIDKGGYLDDSTINYNIFNSYFEDDVVFIEALNPQGSGLVNDEIVIMVNDELKYFEPYEEDDSGPKDSNTFTKSDLIPGEHVVRTRDGDFMLVGKSCNGMFLYNTTEWNSIDTYDDNLLCAEEPADLMVDPEDLDIMEVYTIVHEGPLHTILNISNITSIWERKKTYTQLEETLYNVLAEQTSEWICDNYNITELNIDIDNLEV